MTGSGNIDVTVFGDKKNNEFKKYKKANKNIKLIKNKPQEVLIDIEHLKKLKAIRLLIENIDKIDNKENNIFIMEPLTFSGSKYKLTDLAKYQSENAKLIIENNKLKIIPENYPIIITYKGKYPDIKTQKDIDYCLVIIIFILSYLFSLKLLDYLCDFKNIKNQSRIEIAFLALFFLILFIPISNINREEVSHKEQRRLAQYNPLITKEGKINYNFGKDFNNWFNDRFFMRSFLISFGELKKFLNINWETKDVLKGQNGWLFYKEDNSVRNFQNLDLFSIEDLKAIADHLNKINKYCISKNKKFYFVIAPDKNKIYGENYPLSIKKIRENNKSRANQLISYLKQNTNITSIYLYDTLISHKNEGLYYKTDTHWNGIGAQYSYLKIFDYLKKDYKNLTKTEIIKGEKVNFSGDLNKMLPDFFKQPDDMNYIPKVKNLSYICNIDKYDDKINLCHNSMGLYNLVMYHDSFGEGLVPYFAQTHRSAIFHFKKAVEKKEIENADIVIFEIVERQLPKLTDKELSEGI